MTAGLLQDISSTLTCTVTEPQAVDFEFRQKEYETWAASLKR